MTTPSPADDPRIAPFTGGDAAARPYRLSDHERTLAVNALSDAFSEGRLDADEFRERMSAASEARFAGDLDPLFVDLPGRTPSFLQPATRDPRSHGPQRRSRSPHPHAPGPPVGARGSRPYGRVPSGYPHPMVFMPLIVLIIATTNLWFFLPLLFISLGMMSNAGRAPSRRVSGGCGRRGLHGGPDSTS